MLAAAVAVSAYLLVVYWRSLKGHTRGVRFTLLGLRAATLLLLSLALADLQVGYETTPRARVMVAAGSPTSTRADIAVAGQSLKVGSAARLASMLKSKGLDVYEVSSGDAYADDDDIKGFVGALLLTDGAMNQREARSLVERTSASAGGAPVYVIADTGEAAGASVAMEDVAILGREMRGVPVAISCAVHGRGMRGRESLVTISDDARVQASSRVLWTSDDERQTVTLAVVPKVVGWVDYTAKVEASGGEDPALLSRPFSLYATEGRLRVLFFESEPTWEAKFIRRALEGSGLFEVDYFAQVSRAATVGVAEGAEGDGTGAVQKEETKGTTTAPEARLHAALQSAARLNAYDCVIVGAADNTLLSAAEAARLRDWVERRGGGLIVTGGNSFSGSLAAPGGKLNPLLPALVSPQSFSAGERAVSQGRPLEAEKTRASITLNPTEAGAGGALRGYAQARDDAGGRVAALTGQGFRLGASRPGAAILAVAGQAGAVVVGGGTSETGTPLIAGARQGAGRTLVFAPADSWRMRAGAVGEETEGAGDAFGALWQGMVLWSCEGAKAPALMALSGRSPGEGEMVTAEVRVRDASFSPLRIEKLSARLQPLMEEAGDSSGPVPGPREVAFTPDPSDPSVWHARFNVTTRGRYSLEADYSAGNLAGSLAEQFTVVGAMRAEPGAALDVLRRASRETGGDLLMLHEVDSITERLAASPGKESVRRVWELRAWWPLAFIIPLLLSAEWFARRRWRMDS